MPHVVITGGPGAGKTALLAELAVMGYSTVGESARAIIPVRIAQGDAPGPEPLAFAQEILRRDAEKYMRQQQRGQWVFFDRGAVASVAMVQEASPMPSAELQALRDTYRFHSQVFVLPPWEAIYVERTSSSTLRVLPAAALSNVDATLDNLSRPRTRKALHDPVEQCGYQG